ncbi:hypothetical protein [Algoriphagus antarcticus]|uniref:Uncharacterized protein n=1 Tax=Algoriphagus antarcticus TaxID=238540 RepID=A0A3E0DZB5_9BACT|nr:hypothetical protein [Algoriphagus antarcticus]REG91434.1 hypothetical protein C8N25_10448 [Algoriphagus antarcticus]
MESKKELIERFLATDPKTFQGQTELLALWYDGNGDWEKAHDQVDGLDGKDAARIHAYLHRKEDDQWNADYWYRRAGEGRPDFTLEEEWVDLLGRYLK